jgi:hypothetical protein
MQENQELSAKVCGAVLVCDTTFDGEFRFVFSPDVAKFEFVPGNSNRNPETRTGHRKPTALV